MSEIEDVSREFKRLEQALVEAHYLGLSMRTLAANRNFRYAAITTSVSELLLGWARFVGDRIHEGEAPYAPAPEPQGHPPARRR